MRRSKSDGGARRKVSRETLDTPAEPVEPVRAPLAACESRAGSGHCHGRNTEEG